MIDKAAPVESLEAALGSQVRSARLRLNRTQADLAGDADVSVGALQNLETGKGASVRTLVKVLRALDRLDWLEALQPEVSVSPMQYLLQTKHTRQRARSEK